MHWGGDRKAWVSGTPNAPFESSFPFSVISPLFCCTGRGLFTTSHGKELSGSQVMEPVRTVRTVLEMRPLYRRGERQTKLLDEET